MYCFLTMVFRSRTVKSTLWRHTHELSLSTMSALFSHRAKWNYIYKAGSGFQTHWHLTVWLDLASYAAHRAGHKTNHTTNKITEKYGSEGTKREVSLWVHSWGKASAWSRSAPGTVYYVQALKDLASVQRSVGQSLQQQLPFLRGQT